MLLYLYGSFVFTYSLPAFYNTVHGLKANVYVTVGSVGPLLLSI